jgi:hypothetical protein
MISFSTISLLNYATTLLRSMHKQSQKPSRSSWSKVVINNSNNINNNTNTNTISSS